MGPLGDRSLLALGDVPARAGLTAWSEAVLLASEPTLDRASVSAMPLGARDRKLLDVYEAMFGPAIPCAARCPACGGALDVTLGAAALRHPHAQTCDDVREMRIGDLTVCLRPLSVGDLEAAETATSPDDAVALLLDRCVLACSAPRGGWTDDTVAAVAGALAALDPQADLAAALRCALCDSEWDAPIDVALLLRRRVERRSADLLLDVHRLAEAYHWTEDSILDMPRARRERYRALLDG